jgi:hypothetical protein
MALGDTQQIGDEGDFANITAACFYNGFIWTSGEGQLWRISVDGGLWEQVNDADDWDTRLMVPFGGIIWIVESDGTPYLLDPSTGNVAPGYEGAFAGVQYAVPCGQKLFALAGNQIVAYDEQSGQWTVTDDVEGECYGLFECDETGFFLWNVGGMWWVDSEGNVQNLGDGDAWSGMWDMTAAGGVIYYVWEDGSLYWWDSDSGEDGSVEESGDWTSQRMFTDGGRVFVIDDAGTLFSSDLE